MAKRKKILTAILPAVLMILLFACGKTESLDIPEPAVKDQEPVRTAAQSYLVSDEEDCLGLLWEFMEGRIDRDSCSDLDPKPYANWLAAQYGVRILCGKDVTSYPSGAYKISAHGEEQDVIAALKIFTDTFRKFPEGFIQELCINHNIKVEFQKKIETEPAGIVFYLCGKIASPDFGTSAVGALTTPVYARGGKEHLAFDITNLSRLEGNIAHELFHVIEDKLYFIIAKDYKKIVEDWEKFLPKGVKYYNAYRYPNGRDYSNNSYTIFSPVNGNAYFTDAYAKTFAFEDRARIFEKMFLASGEEPDKNALRAFSYQGIINKGKYLCELLRNNFLTVLNADEVYWEKAINK